MHPSPFLRLLLLAGLTVSGGCGPVDLGVPEVPDDPGALPAGVDPADPASVTGGRNAPGQLDAPCVILVSLDGFASRYVEQYHAGALRALAERGVWARDGMIPVYPSRTFPNHYTLATGLYPAHHGIVANTFFDPARGATYSLADPSTVTDGSWYGGEPLWVTAERQGMVAATYYWVGSEAAVAGVRPSHWRPYDGTVSNDARVAEVLRWLAWPAEYRPHLILLYVSTPDEVGHAYGPDSPQMAAAVAGVDASIARLVAGLGTVPDNDRITLIVLADHGMDAYPASGARYVADVVDMEGITIPEAGPAANLFAQGGAVRAAAVRDSINAGLDGVTAYLADEVPERLHYRGSRRTGDVVLVADSAHVVWPVNDRPATPGFTHGWDNALLSMRALFIAAGPALPTGRVVEPFEAVHVYPLVAHLLGLTPPDVDGDLGVWSAILGASSSRAAAATRP